VRSLGNPVRSFANLMAFRTGWYRDTRQGIFAENHAMRKKLVSECKILPQSHRICGCITF
jgi:hypothetical protein